MTWKKENIFIYREDLIKKTRKNSGLWVKKGIIFEPFQSRIYTHANLYRHVLGQIDYDNYGISGVEKYFDKQLKSNELIKQPLKLTLDTNIQFIVNDELNKALQKYLMPLEELHC